MPLTLELSDIQSELNVCLSVKKKSAPDSEDADAEVSGRSLPCEKTSSKDGGFISAMSVKDPIYKNVGPMAHKYLSTKVDFPYGIHYEKQTGDYRVGHSSVKLVGDDLIINFKGKEKTFKGTEGLWRLLTQDMNYFDENDYFSEKDWETYMKILLITNEELAVRDPDEIPKEELLTEKGETIQISTFCREARYVKEIDELLRRLVDLQKVGLGSKVYCGYTQTCLLFWITSRLVGTIGALNKKTEKLIEWIKLNKKLIEESELLDLVFSGLPFGFNYKTNPICTPRSSSGTRIYTNRQITKMKPQDSDCKAHDKRYQHYLAGDKDLIADAKEGMVNLQEIFISDPSYFEQFDISKKITGKKLNMALQKGLYFLQSYYSG